MVFAIIVVLTRLKQKDREFETRARLSTNKTVSVSLGVLHVPLVLRLAVSLVQIQAC